MNNPELWKAIEGDLSKIIYGSSKWGVEGINLVHICQLDGIPGVLSILGEKLEETNHLQCLDVHETPEL